MYEHIYEGCLSGSLGAHGLTEGELAPILAATTDGREWVRARHKDGGVALFRLPSARADLGPLSAMAARCRDRFSDMVVLGTGGSSLGGRTLTALADSGFAPPTGAPRLHFMDNIDPHSFEAWFETLDPMRTGVIAISKSGGTAETLTQFLICIDAWRTIVGEAALADHFTVITEPGDTLLRRLAGRWEVPVLDHPPGVGGRFSALSLVGLLPAMIAGLDGEAVRAGAAEVLDAALGSAPSEDCAPAVGAALAVALNRHHGIGTTVIMPYADRLASLGQWYGQLWAESLGKQGHGTTPVRALGTVDQHSQLQLYLDGPRDKMFSILMMKTAGTGRRVSPEMADDPELAWLAGRRMGDLFDAEARATAETLIRNDRPTRLLRFARLDEATLGGLMMHFMLETILAARLLGVNAFDQPAVEQGKQLTREYLERMAHE